MRIKITNQINENYILWKKRDMLLAKSKTNQQNRKCHTQQIKDLNNKVEELTQAIQQ